MSCPNKEMNNHKTLLLAQRGFVADSIVDGPGLRCVLFVQGCPHACAGCHNPETHAFAGGAPTTVEELVALVAQNPLCRGVTFSGGEPFCQAGPLAALAARLRQNGCEVAAYSGYTFEQLCQGSSEQRALLAQLDVLIDGPYVQKQKDLKLRFRGSANQRILNVPASLAQGRAVWETAPRWVGGASCSR